MVLLNKEKTVFYEKAGGCLTSKTSACCLVTHHFARREEFGPPLVQQLECYLSLHHNLPSPILREKLPLHLSISHEQYLCVDFF